METYVILNETLLHPLESEDENYIQVAFSSGSSSSVDIILYHGPFGNHSGLYNRKFLPLPLRKLQWLWVESVSLPC